jgi:diguanylate cyclase (GGDEF)-like protein
MERSRKRTPMIDRSKGLCAIALAVGFGCAVFGVGGATAGNGAYLRHVREARLESKLAGLALDHRSPEQLVLAIKPKPKAHTAATPAAVPAAPPTPAAVTTPATTSTAPATTTTTPATTTTGATTTPSNTTTSPDQGSENAGESAAGNPTGTGTTTASTTTTGTTTTGTPASTTTTGTTTTGTPASTTTTGTTTTGTTTTGTTTTGTPASTTTTGTTTTGTTTTGTTTGTTTTGTTTTGTTTTGMTTTGTTTTPGTTTTGTTTTVNSDSSTGHGRQPGTVGSGSTTFSCHGRCDSVTGTSGVVPASLPSTTSSSTSSNFGVTTGSVTPAVLPSTPVIAVSSTTSPFIPVATAPAPPPSPTPAPASSPPASPFVQLLKIPTFTSSSAINNLIRSSGSHHSTPTLVAATAGTGVTTAGGATGAGPAGAAAAGTAAAGTAAAGTAAATTTRAAAHRDAKHPSSGGSSFTSPIGSSVRYLDHFVNVIPTAVWIALGAAFALMLAFAGLAFGSSRRARRREKEFAAISAAALTDALTGILNRRGFTEAAERELARASRYDRPFVLAYVDVRGLKTVNDTEGHLTGDELIKTVAGLMKESARADDVVGRIGGDEFALLLGEQTAESAGPVVRRIQAHVTDARAAMEISVPWELTIGMASFPDDGATLEELLDVADRRLYEQRGIALR